MNIGELGIVILVSIGIFLGAFTFMEDLSFHSDGTPKYNISLPGGTAGNMTAIIRGMNATTVELQNTLTSSEGWSNTIYNIFFNLPANIVKTLADVATDATKIISIATGPDTGLSVPGWVTMIIMTAAALVVVIGLIKLVFGGGG